MRPLRYSTNIILDGCCDHRVMIPDEDLHCHVVENLARAAGAHVPYRRASQPSVSCSGALLFFYPEGFGMAEAVRLGGLRRSKPPS